MDMALYVCSPGFTKQQHVQPRPQSGLTALTLFNHQQVPYGFKQSCLFVCGNAELNIKLDSRPAHQARGVLFGSAEQLRERLYSGRSISTSFMYSNTVKIGTGLGVVCVSVCLSVYKSPVISLVVRFSKIIRCE